MFGKIDSLRKNASVPERLRKRFDASYREQVDDNLAWYDKHHSTIGKWAAATVLRLGLSDDPTPGNSTDDDPSETWTSETPSGAVGLSLDASSTIWRVLFASAALWLCSSRRHLPSPP